GATDQLEHFDGVSVQSTDIFGQDNVASAGFDQLPDAVDTGPLKALAGNRFVRDDLHLSIAQTLCLQPAPAFGLLLDKALFALIVCAIPTINHNAEPSIKDGRQHRNTSPNRAAVGRVCWRVDHRMSFAIRRVDVAHELAVGNGPGATCN